MLAGGHTERTAEGLRKRVEQAKDYEQRKAQEFVAAMESVTQVRAERDATGKTRRSRAAMRIS